MIEEIKNTFSQVLLFQVKPDKTDEFENLIIQIQHELRMKEGCIEARILKRFFTFDDVKSGEAPRQISKVVKCVKYYAFIDYISIDHCGKSVAWLFNTYEKQIMKLLICPFDIMSGYSI